MKAFVLLAVLAGAGCTTAADTPQLSTAETPEEAGLVDIRSLIPDIELDIRYAGSDNFVGKPVDGYVSQKCYLLGPAAQALHKVEQDLREQRLRLKIFDCYRPARAVAHFVRWARDLDDRSTQARFYPNLQKQDLLGVYIAPVSGHSRGATVDLTLLQCDEAGDCEPLDMGTDFDFFDERAHTASPHVSPLQRENRERLRAAMQRHGFRNYPLEWWHYTLTPEPMPAVIHDVPVE
jgi:D-alanyl-D-alanine dipeptidase